MGYRSEVRCIIYGSKENMDAFIRTKALFVDNKLFHEFKDSLQRYEMEIFDNSESDRLTLTSVHCLDLYGEDWKWYPDYEDVRSWTNFMREAPDFNLQYEFIRIGEEVGDIETESSDGSQDILFVSNPTILDNISTCGSFTIMGDPIK